MAFWCQLKDSKDGECPCFPKIILSFHLSQDIVLPFLCLDPVQCFKIGLLPFYQEPALLDLWVHLGLFQDQAMVLVIYKLCSVHTFTRIYLVDVQASSDANFRHRVYWVALWAAGSLRFLLLFNTLACVFLLLPTCQTAFRHSNCIWIPVSLNEQEDFCTWWKGLFLGVHWETQVLPPLWSCSWYCFATKLRHAW